MKRDPNIMLFMFILIATSLSAQQDKYFVPSSIPAADYTLAADIDAEGNKLLGTGEIVFTNNSKHLLKVIAFNWSLSDRLELAARQGNTPLVALFDSSVKKVKGPLFFALPEGVKPGEQVKVNISFAMNRITSGDKSELLLGGWYPRLYWDGLRFASNYKVKFNVPQGYQVAASGKFDQASGLWSAKGIKNFGIYLGKDLKVKEDSIEGVQVRVLHTEKGEKVAAVALETARKAIHFYKEYTGFYPHEFLSIIPGGSAPWGGYPFNPGVVVIHGMDVYEKARPEHWQWITAHEIGHQYWGEHVLEKDYPDWIWIAMGIHLDREFWHSIGSSYDRHKGLINTYHLGLQQKFDTTIDISIPAYEEITFDHNNIIQHGKGFVVISALDSVLGKETFKRVVRRCLQEYKGKLFGYRDLWRVCEEESGENLRWFFDQWVRTDAILFYTAEIIENNAVEGGIKAKAVIKKVGDLAMPLPLELVFEDGSKLPWKTNRFQDEQMIEVSASSNLVKVIIDPENVMGMVKKLYPRNLKELKRDIERISRRSDSLEDLGLFEDAIRLKLDDEDAQLYLGMLLFGGEKYQQAIKIFKMRESLAKSQRDHFVNNAWLGLLSDLSGERQSALKYYKISLENSEKQKMQHSQYGLILDKAWLKERLKTPFKR